jgi:DNA-binding response OmpR family regulator
MTHRNQRGAPQHDPVDSSTCILIIDDDRQASMALSFMLSARGYTEVRAVRSAARALTVAESFHPGIVFLDFELPDKGSMGLAELLRRGAKQHAMRIIALTRSTEHTKREDARVAGFERFLVKPLVQAELDKILRLPAEAPK